MTAQAGIRIDRYRIVEPIGAGAMGEVFLAVDDGLARRVALKILSAQHRENPELRARFVREARAVASVSHPSVVQVFTTGEFDGRPYLAMEYLEGRDLGSYVREHGPLDSREAARTLQETASGLAAAARAGLIHRDVKPSNLMRLADGSVKVTDFGLAKPVETGGDAPALTAFGVVVGTPDYIAPEQARGEAIDWRVDVYALGCTLYYLLTGRPPFRKGSEDEDKYMKVVARHLREPPPDPRDERPGIDVELASLGLLMMSKSPERRPTYDDVIRTAERVQHRIQHGTLAPPPDETAQVEVPAPARARWLVGTTITSGLVFATGLGLLLFGPRPESARANAAPDAGMTPPDAATAVRLEEPPPDMLRATSGGAPFFVDKAAVTHSQYGQIVRSHAFPRSEAEAPVTGISYDYAVQYARARGKRLLRASEWEAALATEGFRPSGMRLWEWVDGGKTAAVDRPVRRAPSGAARRPARGKADTTFRLAKDLP